MPVKINLEIPVTKLRQGDVLTDGRVFHSHDEPYRKADRADKTVLVLDVSDEQPRGLRVTLDRGCHAKVMRTVATYGEHLAREERFMLTQALGYIKGAMDFRASEELLSIITRKDSGEVNDHPRFLAKQAGWYAANVFTEANRCAWWLDVDKDYSAFMDGRDGTDVHVKAVGMATAIKHHVDVARSTTEAGPKDGGSWGHQFGHRCEFEGAREFLKQATNFDHRWGCLMSYDAAVADVECYGADTPVGFHQYRERGELR